LSAKDLASILIVKEQKLEKKGLASSPAVMPIVGEGRGEGKKNVTVTLRWISRKGKRKQFHGREDSQGLGVGG